MSFLNEISGIILGPNIHPAAAYDIHLVANDIHLVANDKKCHTDFTLHLIPPFLVATETTALVETSCLNILLP